MNRVLTIFLILLFSSVLPAAATPPLQRDFLHQMTTALGWDHGLPAKPTDADYLRIMSGERKLHFEVEDVMLPGAQVSLKHLHTYGSFSGTSWVSGTSVPTSLQLAFLLPISGNYKIFANLRLPSFAFEIGNQIFGVDGQERFKRVEIGTVQLNAGRQVITISLPANGGIDDLDLVAPPLPNLEPLGGWQFEQPMTAEDLATITIKMFGLEKLLPPTDRVRLLEAENLPGVNPALRTKNRYLGAPSGGAWVQTGAEPTTLTAHVVLNHPDAVTLKLRGLGPSPLTLRIDGEAAGEVSFASFLQDRSGPTRYLTEGEHTIEITLPPYAGLDSLALQFLVHDPEAYRQLAGISPPDLEPEQMGKLFAFLRLLGPDR